MPAGYIGTVALQIDLSQEDAMTRHNSSQVPPQIVVIGSVNLDVILRARRFPRVGETLTGATVLDALGGKGSNQAVAAARLGGTVAMVACVGDDAAGAHALDVLRSERLDVSRCRVAAEAPTGRAAIVVDDAGRNTIVVADGANALLSPEDVAGAEGLIGGARLVLCQLEIPLDAVAAAFGRAREDGVRTVLNTAPALSLDGLDVAPDVLIANRIEAEQLTGSKPGAPAAELAAALRREGVVGVGGVGGVGITVVTDGEHGAAAADGQRVIAAPTLPVEAIDTVGAGDAFVGAFAWALAAQLPLQRALQLGCAAGSLATQTTGALPSLPTRAELDAALATSA
jgi:ribokinase